MKIALALLVVFLATSVSAMDVNIDIKPSFSDSERIAFTYTITSEIDTDVTVRPYAFCPSAPRAFLTELQAHVAAGVPYQQTYADSVVDESFEPEECSASVSITAPEQKTASKKFRINTKPRQIFALAADSVTGAQYFKKIWSKGETLRLNAKGEAIQAALKYPSGRTASADGAILDELGTYTLTYSLDKADFKAIVDRRVKFVVIEGPAKPTVVSENPPTAPPKNLAPPAKNLAGKLGSQRDNGGNPTESLYLPILLGILAMSLTLFIIFFKRR